MTEKRRQLARSAVVDDAIQLPYRSHRRRQPAVDSYDDRSASDLDEDLDLEVDDGLIRVAWAVQRRGRTGDWALELYEVSADGGEDTIAEIPLEPETAAEMSTALAAAYEDMTGEQVRAASDGGAGSSIDRWYSRDKVRTGVLVALLVLVCIAFVVNVIGGG